MAIRLKSCVVSFLMMSALTGCAVVQGKSTPGQYANDAAATAQIKTKLAQSDITSAPNIHVETQNGIVQMSGFVSDSAQITEAQRIASSVNGVKSVVNDLVVTPPPRFNKISKKSHRGYKHTS